MPHIWFYQTAWFVAWAAHMVALGVGWAFGF